MLADFFILGLTPTANDDSIRRRYLELVRRYPPEKNPERFQKITAAYENIKTLRRRIRARLTDAAEISDGQEALRQLAYACRPQRRPATLTELLNDLKRCKKK